MKATKKGGMKERPMPEAGLQLARCYSIIDLGTQETEYMGTINHRHKIRIGWELCDELHVFDETKGPQPLAISKEYTNSIDEKANLRKDLEGWLGRKLTLQEEEDGIELSKLLGKACYLTIMIESKKDGNPYAKATSISPVKKDTKMPPQNNPNFYFEIGAPDQFELFDKMPEWLREKIKKSKEWADQMTQGISNNEESLPGNDETLDF